MQAATTFLRRWRQAGYPGYRPLLNSVYRNRNAIAGTLATAAGSYGVRRALTKAPASRNVRYLRKPMKKPTKKAPLSKRVKSLEQSHRDTMSKVIYKVDDKDTLRCSASQAIYGYKDACGTSHMELAIAQCRYFDPSNPGTLITASLATPTYKQNILISVSSQMVITNNYQVPCVVTYGVAFNKEDTSITPNVARTNGLTDVGNPDNTSVLVSYKDSPQFRDLWRVKLKSKLLKPGQSIVCKHFQKGFTYDPSLLDSHAQTYQRRFKSAVFIYRCQGVLGHDSSVASEQGIMPAGIDVHIRSVYIVTYDSGGASVRTIVLNEGSSQSFTNGAVTSQVVVDNQSYSIA